MVMKKGTKRIPLGHKYRLQKKVKAHHRKLKKLAKKGGFLHPRKQKPFELNIPKSWPHKEAMLKEVLAEKKDAEGVLLLCACLSRFPVQAVASFVFGQLTSPFSQ